MPNYYSSDQTSYGPSRTSIIGLPGVGKTKLASLWPDPYFVDLDGGAGSSARNRVSLSPGDDARDVVMNEIDAVGRSPFKDGALWHKRGKAEPFPIRTFVIDTLDVVQEMEKTKILGKRTKMVRDDWDVLFNRVYPVILEWHKLPIHVVVVGHTGEVDGEDGKPGIRGFSVQGALRSRMPRWFDYILHIVSVEDGLRKVITQPMIARSFQYLAKDRHGIFGKAIIDLPLTDNGLPDTTIPQRIAQFHAIG